MDYIYKYTFCCKFSIRSNDIILRFGQNRDLIKDLNYKKKSTKKIEVKRLFKIISYDTFF